MYKSEYDLINHLIKTEPCSIITKDASINDYIPSGDDVKHLFQYHRSISKAYSEKGYDMKYKLLSWYEDRPYDSTKDIVIKQTHKAEDRHIEYYNSNPLLHDLFEANIMSNNDHLIIFATSDQKKFIFLLHSDQLHKTRYVEETNDFIKYKMANGSPFMLFETDDISIPSIHMQENKYIIACYTS